MTAVRRVVAVLTAALFTMALLSAAGMISGCGGNETAASSGGLEVVATTGFLRDIAQQVAGERFTVKQLMPDGADPHAFELAPSDLRAVAAAGLLIVNGGGLEGTLLDTLAEAGSEATVVTASTGIPSRTPQPGEPPLDEGQTDPHYWLDPTLVERYVATIRDAFTRADPEGARSYDESAAVYVARLKRLDAWIRARVESVPAGQRMIVTDHSSLGYFADRYKITVVGTVLPSVASGEPPSARQLAELTEAIRSSGVRAIVVDSGEDPRLAQQVAAETGITVIDDLLDHSLTPESGPAHTYVAMMKHDTLRLVEAMTR